MKMCGSVIVKQLSGALTISNSQQVQKEIVGLLAKGDRPCLVLDCSLVGQLDSAGIECLLRTLEEAMKRNGDIKLAALCPQVAVILKLTRVDRLFEIFEKPSDAAESFERFLIPESGRTGFPSTIEGTRISGD